MAEQCRGNPERVQRQRHPSFHIVTYCRSEFRTRPLRSNNAVLKDRVRKGSHNENDAIDCRRKWCKMILNDPSVHLQHQGYANKLMQFIHQYVTTLTCT